MGKAQRSKERRKLKAAITEKPRISQRLLKRLKKPDDLVRNYKNLKWRAEQRSFLNKRQELIEALGERNKAETVYLWAYTLARETSLSPDEEKLFSLLLRICPTDKYLRILHNELRPSRPRPKSAKSKFSGLPMPQITAELWEKYNKLRRRWDVRRKIREAPLKPIQRLFTDLQKDIWSAKLEAETRKPLPPLQLHHLGAAALHAAYKDTLTKRALHCGSPWFQKKTRFSDREIGAIYCQAFKVVDKVRKRWQVLRNKRLTFNEAKDKLAQAFPGLNKDHIRRKFCGPDFSDIQIAEFVTASLSGLSPQTIRKEYRPLLRSLSQRRKSRRP